MELDQSQASLNVELDSFYNKCLQNIDYQRIYWIELEEFISEHQIGSETIRSHLDHQFDESFEPLSLEQLEEFDVELKKRRNEFMEKILMNKSIEFKPELSALLAKHTIRYGVPKRVDLIPNSILTAQMNRLKEFVFSKETIAASNSFEFDMDIIKSNTSTPKYSLHSLDACQRILISSLYEPTCTNLHMFDLFGNLIKKLSILHKVLGVYSNSSKILVSFRTDRCFFLSLYNQELVRIKQIQIFVCPVCCYFNDDKTCIITDTMPFVQVYDKNLSLSTKLGHKLNGNSLVENVSAFGHLLFIQEKFTDLQGVGQVSVLNMNSGLVEKIFQVPFVFDCFYVLTSNLILFFVGDECAISVKTNKNKSLYACCFDISKKKIRNKVKFHEMYKDCVYCLTKEGLILTLDKNILSVY